MKTVTFAFAMTVLTGWGAAALAAPVNAVSELALFHAFTINDGSKPEGVSLRRGSFDAARAISTSVDDGSAVTTSMPFAQVGIPFHDPPVPVIRRRVDRTTINGGLEGSQAQYDLEITETDDPDLVPNEFAPIERVVETTGAARIFLAGDAVGAAAESDYLIERTHLFENPGNATIAFDIVGDVLANLTVGHDGPTGLAQASGRLSLGFADVADTAITFVPLTPYQPVIDDADAGALVMETLTTGTEGFDFGFSASVMADGTSPVAGFEGGFRYLFQVRMDPGARFRMISGFEQNKIAAFAPIVAVVPAPDSLPLLLAVLAGACVLSRRAVRTP